MSDEQPIDPDLERQALKAQREWAKDAHPFDRSQRLDAAELVLDDGSAADVCLVAFPGTADRLGIPSVDFFESIADWSVRRIYVRGLIAAIEQPHPLGTTVPELASSLRNLTEAHNRTVYLGTSLGGFHSLLLGSFAGADAVVTINPITSCRPAVLEAAGDNRWDGLLAETSPEWLQEFGDLPELWQRQDPPEKVFVHYPYRNPMYAVQAEHVAEQPHVVPIPHYEHSPMDKIHESGELRRVLKSLLWPN